MSMLKKIFIKFWYVWIVVVIALLAFWLFTKNGQYETVDLKAGEFVREISVVGNVIPVQEADMAFEVSGRVSTIHKKVGQNVSAGESIVSLDSGEIRASLLRAESDLEAEQALLDKYKSNNSTLDLASIKNEIRNSYTVSDDAIRTKVDRAFDDSNSYNPEFLPFVSSYELENELELGRRSMRELLKKWSEDITKMQTSNTLAEIDIYAKNSKANLNLILRYLDRISYALSIAEQSGDVTETDLESISAGVSTARSNVNTAISDLATTYENIANNSQEIPYQEAKVKSALANVKNYEAQLAKNSIRAPFSGVITKIDVELGEIVSITEPSVSISSNSAFQIETFVPEVNIKDLKIGDHANVTLDALGEQEIFGAKVISIDPAQTVRDGVSTYKTKFEFEVNDERIRSGMTANVIITTEKRQNVFALPPTAIYKIEGVDFVKVLVGKNVVEKQVTVGGFDAFGNREVISGLSAGEKVIKNPNQK